MTYALLLSCFFLLFASITWRDFVFGVGLFAALLPAYTLRFSVGPLPVTTLEGMFFILFFVWFLQEVRAKKIQSHFVCITRSRFFYPGLLLVASAAISVFWATDRVAALGILKAYFIEPFLLYMMLISRVRSQEAWKKVFIGLGVSVFFVTAIAIVQSITGMYLPTWEWTLAETRRATGPFTSPNALGLLVVPIGAMFLAWRFTNQRWPKWLEVFSVAVIFSAGLAIVLALSKGAILAYLAVAMMMLYLVWSPKKTVILGSIALLVLLALPSVRSQVISLATFQQASGQSRITLYKGAMELLQKHPITGLGLASFADMFETVRPAEYYEELIYPHNLFLNTWSETGILGLAALLWIVFICVHIGWQYRHQRNGLFYSWIFLAALLPMFVHGMVDVPYFKNDLAMLTWILLAGLAWSAKEKEGERLFCS